MKLFLIRLLRHVPGARRLAHLVRTLAFFWPRRGLTREQIFTGHYDTNWWRDPESRSGAGATLRYTENIRRNIPKLVAELGIETILDAPCGDYNWFRHVPLPEHVRYIGGDIVPALVELNQQKYGSDRARFVRLDIVSDPLPDAGLWLCRATLFHLSDRDVWAALDNFLRSRIRYLLTTTMPESFIHRDIVTGHYRPLNLERPPFSLGCPLRSIDDWVPGFDVMKLCLWERDALAATLRHNAAYLRFQRKRPGSGHGRAA